MKINVYLIVMTVTVMARFGNLEAIERSSSQNNILNLITETNPRMSNIPESDNKSKLETFDDLFVGNPAEI